MHAVTPRELTCAASIVPRKHDGTGVICPSGPLPCDDSLALGGQGDTDVLFRVTFKIKMLNLLRICTVLDLGLFGLINDLFDWSTLQLQQSHWPVPGIYTLTLSALT